MAITNESYIRLNSDSKNVNQQKFTQAHEFLKQGQELIQKSKSLIRSLSDTEDVTFNLKPNSNNTTSLPQLNELTYNLQDIDDSIEDSLQQIKSFKNACTKTSYKPSSLTKFDDLLISDNSANIKLSNSIAKLDNTIIPIAPNPDTKYAPQRPVKKGNKDLCCISINWQGKNDGGGGGFNRTCNAISSNYKRLSGGLFNINTRLISVQVPYTKSYRNVKAATSYAKNVANARRKDGKYDWFAIHTKGAAGVSRAGGNTAILKAAGAASHEVGHLIGFGHANKLRLQKKFRKRADSTGKNGIELNLGLFRTDGSGDGSSIMSTFPSGGLTAPQLYSKGWLAKEQVAQHDVGSQPIIYKLQTLNSKAQAGRLKSVLIPSPRGENGRDLFLSAIQMKSRGKNKGKDNRALTLHLGNPSSIRVITFKNQPTTVLGHTFELIQQDGNNFDVKISPHKSQSNGM